MITLYTFVTIFHHPPFSTRIHLILIFFLREETVLFTSFSMFLETPIFETCFIKLNRFISTHSAYSSLLTLILIFRKILDSVFLYLKILCFTLMIIKIFPWNSSLILQILQQLFVISSTINFNTQSFLWSLHFWAENFRLFFSTPLSLPFPWFCLIRAFAFKDCIRTFLYIHMWQYILI